MTRLFRLRAAVVSAVLLMVSAHATTAHAQSAPGRFLGREDILLYGIGLKAEPAQQTVPKDIATIVSTMFVAPQTPGNLPPFGPDAVVKATLRGPSFTTPIDLTVKPNSPFNIPPLTVAGKHTLDNIRVIDNGEVVLRGNPESTIIDVIDRLLITEVTARPLTAAEIREKGLVFDKSSFQAYNFAAAFAIQDKTIPINFTVVLPTLLGAEDVPSSEIRLPGIGTQPGLPSLQTVIPESLKRLQTQIPNLNVQGFTLKVPELKGQDFYVPPIPGVVVIPGDIGFLNQFFSVMLMVGNVAPAGSNLVVTNLKAEIVLPPGADTVVGSPDDPLRMGRTDRGEVPRLQPVRRPGPDGALGTADDVDSLGPGESGNAEYLIEGRREGSHTVEMEITGTLIGLPIGPVTVRGRAKGTVLVRNPTFTLTFTHPEVVTAGEAYALDVTVTNTSAAPANFVTLNLFPRVVSGATIIGDPTRQIETIAPGDSQTVSFDLIAKVSGKVFAATLDGDENVTGRFALKTSVGELGIPLSPDSLVLPREAGSLPLDLRTAALGLLGKAYAVATAPASALPRDVKRFSKKLVWDRAIEVAESGLRVSLHEPLRDSATQLLMDVMGSNYARLAATNPNAEDLAFAQGDFEGFDDLRRRSTRGDAFAQAVAALMKPDLASLGPRAFHHDLAEKIQYRPGHISVLLSAPGALPVALSLVDDQGRRVGGTDVTGKVVREIPFSDFLQFADAGTTNGQMAFIASPAAGHFTVRLDPVPGVTTASYTLSIVVPDAQGELRQLVFEGVPRGGTPSLDFASSDPYRLSVGGPAGPASLPSTTAVADRPPYLVGVVQQGRADQVCVDVGKTEGRWRPGRIVALLFSEEVTPETVQDKFTPELITNFLSPDNQIVGVALQPGRRIVFVALRDPVGPFVPRTITVTGVADGRGHVMASDTLPIEITAEDPGAVVSGRVLRADGTGVPFASLRLFYACPSADDEIHWIGISSKTAGADGRYSWDYVLSAPRILAVDPETEESRDVQLRIARNGQRLNVDIVLLGRGTLEARALDEAGTPLKETKVRVTSLTDNSQYAATSDADGRFTVARVPVGNIFIEAVNTTANALVSVSDLIPFAGAVVTRDLVLLRPDSPRQVTLKTGTITGHVLRGAGTEPLAGLPVTVIYKTNSQPGVACPPAFTDECPIALAATDAAGAFSFAAIPAGRLRLETFDQATLEEGDASLQLAADGQATVNIVISGGVGTVKGIVLDPAGHGVPDARIGGGRTLVSAGPDGRFTLPDVPLGRRQIVAVSDALGSRGVASIDITRAGEEVPVTIVLDSMGKVAGTLFRVDGTTPVAGVIAYLYKLPIQGGRIEIVGQATSDGSGHYLISDVPLGTYRLTAFTADFSDGNLVDVNVKFNGQTVKADVIFRGGNGGSVRGTVVDANDSPIRARVSISGDQPVIAGGRVVVRFEYIQNFSIVDTDFSTGQFAMQGLWAGPYTVRAAGPFSPDPISLQETMPVPPGPVDLTLKLQATSQIAGTILKADGTHVGAGVLVKYKSDEYKSFCSENSLGETTCTTIPQGIQEAVAVTDEQGAFLFAVVNAGTYTLSAFENADLSGRTARVRGSVRSGEKAEVTVQLPAVADLIVKVYASDARTLVPGATVEVKQIDYPNRRAVLFSGQSGADLGVAAFTGGDAFSAGAFVVTATGTQQNGFAGVASGKIETDGETVTVNVYLATATGSVHGTVRRADGSLAPNAQVVISNTDGAIGFTITDGAGNYQQDLIPLGPFTVDVFEAANAGHGSAHGQIFLANQSVPADITEDALALITGRVVEAGSLTPLKGWQVTVSQSTASGRSLSLRTTTGVDGGYSFPGAAVGPFQLSAFKLNVQGQGNATGEIDRPGAAVDVPILVPVTRAAFGRIEGTVFHANGTRAGNAAVCVGACDGPGPRVTAAADGTFTIENVPLGRALINAAPQTGLESGSALTTLEFDGDAAQVQVVLAGLSQIDGTVFLNGAPAAGARVSLLGIPMVQREAFADGHGHFSFVDVSARSFTITAAAAPSFTVKGVASERLNPGESKHIDVVLEPTGSLRGRAVLESTGMPMAGVTADLLVNGRHFFTESAADGAFAFDTLPLGRFTLALQDPIGIGVAAVTGTLAGSVLLGDIMLDASSPVVAAMVPQPSATGVPKSAPVQLTMSEAIDPATVSAASVTLSSPDGPVAGTVTLSGGDKVIAFTPLAPLHEQTKYAVRASGLADRVGHVMHAPFVASFTTADTIPPVTLDISPAPSTSGAPISAPIRIKFDEPIDVAKFQAAGLTLSGPGGAVTGRTDFLFGNTVVVLTPDQPLNDGAVYHVHVPAAVDLSSNRQAQGADYSFSTTNRTPPAIAQLIPANSARVIENTVTSVAAVPGAFDVAFIDFFLNDVFAATVPAPFVFQFQAVPALGTPGSQIKVSAIATDTSGNRGITFATTQVLISPDAVPTLSLAAPVSAANGEHVEVTLTSADDVGVTQISIKPETGRALDAVTRTVTPAARTRTDVAGFTVPSTATPGSTIAIKAAAVDTKGQAVERVANLVITDAVAPSVTITGASSGTQVRPGQQTTIVVSVQDAGGIRAITFRSGGVASATQTRVIEPAQTSVVTSFTVTVPAGARPPASLTLDATAEDRAGNTGAAARVILPVGDNVPPSVVSLRTDSGRLQVVRGRSVTVIVDAEDDLGVSEIGLSGQGAFSFTERRQAQPPLSAASATFTFQVPPDAPSGALLNLQATAIDTAGNTSPAAALALTVTALPEVTFGPSVILNAGESAPLALQISEPAPEGGLRIDFATNAAVVTTTPFVVVAPGQSTAAISVSGVAGGTGFINAIVQGVQRGSATATVQGGIVSGIVRDEHLVPAAGAKVTVLSGLSTFTAETDGAGRYRLFGVPGPNVTVKVLKDVDATTRLLGFASGSMNRTNGFVTLDVGLVAAGFLHGPVKLADGTTIAPNGVRVDLFDAANLGEPLATTFTSNGVYEFPLVALGRYVVEANGTSGQRGRANAEIASSGQDVEAPVTFLGRGTVTVTVRDGAGQVVRGALVSVSGFNVFGATPPVSGTAVDGTFAVHDLPFGTFLIQARDPVTNLAASVSGQLDIAMPNAAVPVLLASYGGLQGTVYRADGVTTVPGAAVSAFGVSTTADTRGHYSFAFLPLGQTQVSARDTATRGIGYGSVTLGQQGQTKTLDVTMFAQGTLVVSVRRTNGTPVANAGVLVSAGAGVAGDTLFAETGATGIVVLNHVIVGGFQARATSGALVGTTSGQLAAGEQRAVDIVLEPTAAIAGLVRGPNDAPVSAGSVQLAGPNQYATVAIAPDGTFRADNLKLGTYSIEAYDPQGHRRAILAQPIVLAVPDQVAQTTLTFVGVGTVTGRVLNPDGSSAIGLTVQVRSLNTTFGGFRPPVPTNNGGFYEVPDVPVGDFTVSVANPTLHLRGEGSGTIASDGASPRVDVLLQNNLIDLPATRWDANNFLFDVQRDGSILNGTSSVFGGAPAGQRFGAMRLEIANGTSLGRFTGSAIGTVEDRNRELAVHQDNVAGLDVTRKVFVPAGGYFARYLELLTNPTGQPVTIDVRITSHEQGNNGGADASPHIVTTSNGDAVLDAGGNSADRWVVIDDVVAGDPFVAGGLPATAFVLDGPDATRGVGSAALAPAAAPLAPRALTYAWQAVTIPAGGTVALLHFVVQQTGADAAQASAERLVQLPPEAVAGLTVEELSAIQNFAVRVDGSSPVAPLAPITGAISGRVFASDRATAVGSVPVRLKSGDPLFRRTYATTAAADGSFSFVGTLDDSGTSRAVPIASFTLTADHPALGSLLASPPAAGSFGAAALSAQQDVVFSNTATLRGVVRLNDTPASGASVTASGHVGSTAVAFTAQGGADGSFFFPLLPSGPLTLQASAIQQGVGVQGSVATTVTANASLTVDVPIDTLAPQVAIVSPAAGAAIDPRQPLAVTLRATDAGGVASIGVDAGGTATASLSRIVAGLTSAEESFSIPFETLPPTGGSVTLIARARDTAGHQTSSAPVVVSVRDVVAPAVVLVAPADADVNVEAGVRPLVRFSEPVVRASVTSASVRLTTGGVLVPVTFTFADGDRVLTVIPAAPLASNRSFVLSIDTQVTDAAGNGLAAQMTSTFRTSSPDTISPRVQTVAPADGAVNVPVGTDVRITFSEAIDAATITPSSFRVTVGGTVVPGTFNLLDGSSTVRFAPQSALPFDAVVVVELTSAITDLFQNPLVAGNGAPLTQPLTFTFLTGTFGITAPVKGSEVLESSVLTLQAQASAALNIATVTFTVNGQALPAVQTPFATQYTVGSAATTPTLTIVAAGRNAAGGLVAQDQVTVSVVAGLGTRAHLIGIPTGGTTMLRLTLPGALPADLPIALAAVDPAVAGVPAAAVLRAGQTEVAVPVAGASTGTTTITASSARGTAWAVASVSPLTARSLSADAAAAGVVVSPSRVLGQVFTGTAQQRTIDVPILSANASVATLVSVTSSDASVADVQGVVTIGPGSRSARITISTGVAGTATLTLRAGGEIVLITVVAGAPPAGTVGPIVARPAGFVLVPPAGGGRVYSVPSAQSSFRATLLGAPAATDLAVVVSSSDPAVASVAGAVVVHAGSRTADVVVTTGARGKATLTLSVAGEARRFEIVVGGDPGELPAIVSRPVGFVALAPPSAGRVVLPVGNQSTVSLPLLSSPAAAPTVVTVTSSDRAIADVAGQVIVPAGSRSASLTIAGGSAGIATITFRAGSDVRELSVVIGSVPAAMVPPVVARPVGLVLLPARRAGTLLTGTSGASTVSVPLLVTPAAVDTPVQVTSSDANVASVVSPVVIVAGSRVAPLTIVTRTEGAATLTLRVGDSLSEMLVVVGPPPATLVPVVIARPIGLEIR